MPTIDFDSGIEGKGTDIDSSIRSFSGSEADVVTFGYYGNETDATSQGLVYKEADGFIRGIDTTWDICSSGIIGKVRVAGDLDSAMWAAAYLVADSALLAKSNIECASGIIGEKSEVYAARFNKFNIDNVSSSANYQHIKTVVRVLFDYDYAAGDYRKAVTVKSDTAIRIYDRIETEIRAEWISDTTDGIDLAFRLLNYYARIKWDIQFTSDLTFSNVTAGTYIHIEHPLLPVVGRVMVMEADMDIDSGEIKFVCEKLVDTPVVPEVEVLASKYRPKPPDQLQVSYANGTLTLIVTDNNKMPMAGAVVTLDATTSKLTTGTGSVSFVTKRGIHLIHIEATGFDPLDWEIEV